MNLDLDNAELEEPIPFRLTLQVCNWDYRSTTLERVRN